jgi:NCAIR mutase (PurE)-related protein
MHRDIDRQYVEKVLKALRRREITVSEAMRRLSQSYQSLGFATLDVDRELRTGVSEAVLCEGKSHEQVVMISRAIHKRTGRLLATRASREVYRAVKKAIPGAKYNQAARLIMVGVHRHF